MLISGTRYSEILDITVSAVHSSSFSSAGKLMHAIVSVMYSLTETIICVAVRFFLVYAFYYIALGTKFKPFVCLRSVTSIHNVIGVTSPAQHRSMCSYRRNL